MTQRSILSMFKKKHQDTICRPGKPTDTLSKSRTADPTFNRLGRGTGCRPGNPTDTLLESRLLNRQMMIYSFYQKNGTLIPH